MKRFGLLVSALCLSVSSSALAEETVNIAGSSTVRPVVKEAVNSFKADNPGVNFNLSGGGSSTGVKNAGEGKVSIGMASRAVKEKEHAAYSDIVVTRIGTDGVALLCHGSNPVKSITADQVRAVFTGQITNWKELGGKDATIQLIAIDEVHGTHEMFAKYFGMAFEQRGEGKAATTFFKLKDAKDFGSVSAKKVASGKDTLAAVVSNPNALGYSSIGLIEAMNTRAKRQVLTPLALDGKEASISAVSAGTYPLSRPLNLITKGEPTGAAKQFIDFMLSDKGQAIVAKFDFIPAGQGATAAVETE